MTTDTTPALLDVTTAPVTWKTLEAISRTDFVPKSLRGNTPAILACVLAGRELGMGPMEALRTIDMIDGRPHPSAEWMVGKVFDAGHVIAALEQSATACTVEGVRFRDGAEVARMQFTFTIDMAQRAGLAGKSNWKNYPEAMLYWRAVAQLCRQFFPDMLRGLKYTPEELGDGEWVPPGTEAPVAASAAEFDAAYESPEVEVVDEGYADDDPERPFA